MQRSDGEFEALSIGTLLGLLSIGSHSTPTSRDDDGVE
jgi:hypothetical protein